MNKEFILRLAKRMRNLKHEEHYSQNHWAGKDACGTFACLAGHAVLLKDHKLPKLNNYLIDEHMPFNTRKIYNRAMELLGLTENQANVLFCASGSSWPDPFYRRMREGKEKRSKIASDFLEAIANGEVKL